MASTAHWLIYFKNPSLPPAQVDISNATPLLGDLSGVHSPGADSEVLFKKNAAWEVRELVLVPTDRAFTLRQVAIEVVEAVAPGSLPMNVKLAVQGPNDTPELEHEFGCYTRPGWVLKVKVKKRLT